MRVVIAGAGQAGGWFAKTLLGAGFEGEILLVGAERHPPYQRPPLSKEVLVGERRYVVCYNPEQARKDAADPDLEGH